VHLIHGVDSLKLLKEINKHGEKSNRIINVLLQIHIAKEETKFGFDKHELEQLHELHELKNVQIVGLMGMASFSDDMNLVRTEFTYLKSLFDSYALSSKTGIPATTSIRFNTVSPVLSMGMSGDYKIALEEGSNMVRIGSLIFGERNYTN